MINLKYLSIGDGRIVLFIGLGAGAFLLFFLYEAHVVSGRFRVLHACFLSGCLLLTAATLGLAAGAVMCPDAIPARLIGGGCGALVFLALLVYTLFFALPFSATYTQAGGTQGTGKPCVCRTGVYALCRHPGVLWLAGVHLCVWLMSGTGVTLAAFLLFTALNVAYVTLQDSWSFPRCFADYDDYKKNVPFLLPRPRSVRRCFETLAGR